MKRRLAPLFALLALLFAPPAPAAQSWQLSGYIYRQAIPMVLPSSGTFGTNGALTLSTALPTTYAVGGYFYFPAGAICAGSAAGLYFTIMSSATVGVVYTNQYTSGTPTVPASPTATVCASAPGAYTQVLTTQTLITYPLAGGFLSASGWLGFYETWDYANSASAKTLVTALGGSTVVSAAPTTTAHTSLRATVENRGSTSAQVVDAGGYGALATPATFLTVATGSNQNITVTADLAAAADYVVLEGLQIAAAP